MCAAITTRQWCNCPSWQNTWLWQMADPDEECKKQCCALSTSRPSLFFLKLVVIRYESRKHAHVFDARACVPEFAEEQIKVFCTLYDDDFGDNFEAPCPYISWAGNVLYSNKQKACLVAQYIIHRYNAAGLYLLHWWDVWTSSECSVTDYKSSPPSLPPLNITTHEICRITPAGGDIGNYRTHINRIVAWW